MDPSEYSRKLDEFDRLMDDEEPAAAPERLWQLLAELSRHDLQPSVTVAPASVSAA